jgi:hypothetical protein
MENLQVDLSEEMREVLLNWLSNIHDTHFRKHGTPMVFLTINIIDRYLSRRRTHFDKLQLVGIAALNLAHKFENGIGHDLLHLQYLCGNGCSADEITRAERIILRTLDYRLAWPGPLPFLERISKARPESGLVKNAAEYILEATAINYACVGKLPSLIAAAAFFLAQLIMGNSNWVCTSFNYILGELI